MRKHRPYTGLLLLASAIAVVLAPQCGLLGHVLARGLNLLIGWTGTVLLTGTLVVMGLMCLVPRGTVGRLVTSYRKHRRQQSRALVAQVVTPVLSRGEELRQAMVAQGYDADEVEQVLPQMVQLSEGIESQIRKAAKAHGKVVPLRPVHDDVRAGLKSLGYVYAEIDTVLPQLDRSQDTAGQIRQALKLLRKAS